MKYLDEQALIHRLREIAVVPVAVFDDAQTAIPTAKALCNGGLSAIEVTFRTAAAAESIAAIKNALPDMLVGAGTVLTPEQAVQAVEAGADFLVSPGLNVRTLNAAKKLGIPMVPGICTPTEAEAALELGHTFVKFFPAEAAGGIAMLRAMSAPYSMLQFMPTGGISLENLSDYLSFSKIVACGGSFMLKKSFIADQNYAKITELSRQTYEIVAQIRKEA